jgi:hypothetical protein
MIEINLEKIIMSFRVLISILEIHIFGGKAYVYVWFKIKEKERQSQLGPDFLASLAAGRG